jgi:SAM-dependent methyltransferase
MLRFHESYCGQPITGKRILELGPGSDLGIGLHQIASGAKHYCGFDVHGLADQVPTSYYEQFAKLHPVELSALTDGRIDYIVDDQFNLAVLGEDSFDVAFSNAAFEHFEDVFSTLDQLLTVLSPGGLLVAEVDLQTHSRWIKDKDPNNIYRYSDRVYSAFHFPGQPNRIRPEAYAQHLATTGWTNVQLRPQNKVPQKLTKRRADKSFQASDMTILSFLLLATRPAQS